MPKKHTTRTGYGYYSDHHPYKLYSTQSGARTGWSKLRGKAGIKKRIIRTPTFYSYMHTKIANKIGRAVQGPHTFPHHGIHQAISRAVKQDNFSFLESIIRSPTDYSSAAKTEIPDSHAKRFKRDRAITAYNKRHTRYLTLKSISPRTEIQNIRYAHVINKMIQMDPYGSYAYKSNTKAKKKATRGKGERSSQPLSGQIDQGGKSTFNSQTNYTNHQQRLLTMANNYGIK